MFITLHQLQTDTATVCKLRNCRFHWITCATHPTEAINRPSEKQDCGMLVHKHLLIAWNNSRAYTEGIQVWASITVMQGFQEYKTIHSHNICLHIAGKHYMISIIIHCNSFSAREAYMRRWIMSTLLQVRRQAIIYNNGDLLSVYSRGTNAHKIQIITSSQLFIFENAFVNVIDEMDNGLVHKH